MAYEGLQIDGSPLISQIVHKLLQLIIPPPTLLIFLVGSLRDLSSAPFFSCFTLMIFTIVLRSLSLTCLLMMQTFSTAIKTLIFYNTILILNCLTSIIGYVPTGFLLTQKNQISSSFIYRKKNVRLVLLQKLMRKL